MQQFEGRTAVVIGAGSGGIGTGIAEACARAAMNVVVADIDTDGAARVAEALNGRSGPATRGRGCHCVSASERDRSPTCGGDSRAAAAVGTDVGSAFGAMLRKG